MSDKFLKQLPGAELGRMSRRTIFTADGMPEGGFCRVYFSVQSAAPARGIGWPTAPCATLDLASPLRREAAQQAEAAAVGADAGAA